MGLPGSKSHSKNIANGESTEATRASRYQHYSLDQKGLLRYQGRIIVPQQKSLIHKLLYLYYNN